MSLKEEQPQEYNVRAGLTMFNNLVIATSNLNGGEKPVDQAPVRKESASSNNSPPVKNSSTSSNSSTPPTSKRVGSNRFVIFQFLYIVNSFLFSIRFFIPAKK
jgi:hypothetical protein